ncbi:MAG TPA: hypothetical protein VIV56_05435, partial [Gemmatimonadales bacterium]
SAEPVAPVAAVAPVKPVTPPVPPAVVEVTPEVSPARRSAGQIVSATLLVVLVVGAMWFAYHLAFAHR